MKIQDALMLKNGDIVYKNGKSIKVYFVERHYDTQTAESYIYILGNYEDDEICGGRNEEFETSVTS